MSLSLQPLTGTYEEVVLSPELIARICPLRPCGDPLCDCRIEPACLFLYSDVEGDAWVAGRVLPEASMDDLIAMIASDNHTLEHLLVNSILFGCSWAQFTGPNMNTLVDRQQEAHIRIPSWYWERPVEELRRLRAAIYEIDPSAIAELLLSVWYAGVHDTGGRRGHPG